MRGKTHTWETTSSGCIVSSSHKLNQDGYLRMRDHRMSGEGKKPLVMAHRLVWELTHDLIPDDYEIDHKCRNRACVNVNHLQVLDGHTHAVKTNMERYAQRQADAKAYWETEGCTGTHLSQVFGVSFSVACRWIRGWKA